MCVEEGVGPRMTRVLLEHGANPDSRDAADVPIAFYALLRQVREDGRNDDDEEEDEEEEGGRRWMDRDMMIW